MNFLRRLTQAQRSLRLRLLGATLTVLAIALGVSVLGFEHVARGVVLDAARSHLTARAREVLEATERFQRERELTAHNWAEAEAMQLSLDSGDPKFAEDYLKRAIQDQGGAFSVVALLDAKSRVVCAVHAAPEGERRGKGREDLRKRTVRLGAEVAVASGARIGLAVGSAEPLGATPEESPALTIAAPVRDFTGELVGLVVAAVSRPALVHLLTEVGGGDAAYVPLLLDAERQLVIGLDGVDERVVGSLLEPGAQTRRAGLELHGTPGARWLAVRTAMLAGVPGWRAVMAISEQEAYGALRRLRKLLVIVFALVLVGATAVSVVALRQASRPLVDVSSSMARVAEGDLTTRLPQGYRGELGQLVGSFNTMVSEVARSHDALKRTEALRRELQIAQALQTGILPRNPELAGFEVAARMKPAENVGGDLYDILSFPDSFWLVIGDVSGHGLQSGLVMLMAQAAAYSAISSRPDCTPREVLGAVNRVLHENVRRRMRRDDYLTLMVARHAGDGRFVAAGAHQPLFLARAGGGVDVLEPAGPWCGVMEDVEPRTPQYEFQLGPGDLLCLITDGIVEARGAGDDLYGQDRLAELLGRRRMSAPEVLGDIFSSVEAFATSQEDDMTAVVLKRRVVDVGA